MPELQRGRRKTASAAQATRSGGSSSGSESEGSFNSTSKEVAAERVDGRGGKRKRGLVVLESANSDSEAKEAKAISAQEEADLSSALIAKLLAEDAGGSSGGGFGGGQYMGYYDDYRNSAGVGGDAADEFASGSEPDDEWDPSAKSRRTSKNTKARRQAGGRAARTERAASPESGSENPAGAERRQRSQRQKRLKSAGKPQRAAPEAVAPGQFRSGAYTDEEERMFYAGLELFGRSWSEISGHVGTRDAKSIRSHAQKYFIKLFRDGQPLPAKVKESGDGYTLSGRPLDPNSAAARPYLQHVMELDPPAPKPPKMAKASAPPSTDRASDLPASEPCDAEEESVVDSKQPETQPTEPAMGASAAGDPTAEGPAPISEPEPIAEQRSGTPPGRTEYAMSRPQRSHARTVALRYSDPHQMVRCTPFQGQPLSGAAGSQPFRLVVHTNAQLQMDFHSHLMLSEVIGLLGGQWDAANKVLTVARAFPCAALETEDAHTNVEMDPGSELVVRHQIVDAGLCVVGWYHSHPTFRPDPSIIDIENQTAYQTLFRDNSSSEEPFVGAIVGPYDPELPGPVSAFNWFYVGRSVVDRGHPKRLAVEPMPNDMLPEAEREMLLSLIDSTTGHKHCAPLEEAWRPSSTELRSLKMAVSLSHRMPWLSATPAPHCADQEPARFESADKQIPAADLFAGQRAVRDPLLAALASRFGAGVFKVGSDGKLADAPALERVYAAYFMQWPLAA
ncbi:hypothetical protein H4R26_002328 [Coemansia thaxteri]|uniref:Myb-like, SWIRM and MPN domain-containing protein 1 n=1 Tax=Coemansia thaxteri TaxID=2663907 RepID=A0A9W8BEI9_9FUNG|nr:hypothetical protein H4R26_002328 [Coemansia thaxteri]KAJ2487969.1 hypothetical protein EV174_000206 [Coemansia sp. RSA 2320]